MSQFTSTLIDDEELIEELRRYGEQNLPALPVAGTRVTKRSHTLTDQNREIYLKKLNHYRAREKAENNPSKYLKQQQQQQHQHQNSNCTTKIDDALASAPAPTKPEGKNHRRSSARFQLDKNIYYEIDASPPTSSVAKREPGEGDVIEIENPNDATCEYVTVSNAHTSPLSNSQYHNNTTSYNDEENESEFAALHRRQSILTSTYLPAHNNRDKTSEYVSLKDKIELDKTLSKYRSDISNLITGSIIKNRQTLASSKPTSEIIYEGTTYSGGRQKAIETLYCPKPAASSTSNGSLFSRLKSSLSKTESVDTNVDTTSPYYKLSQIRGGHADLRNRLKPHSNGSTSEQQSKQQRFYSTPVKSFNGFLGPIKNFYRSQLSPGLGYLGMRVSQLFPYLLFILLTIILLEYARLKFINNDMSITGDTATSEWDANQPDVVEQFSQKPSNSPPHLYCWDIKDPLCAQTKLLVRELIDYLRAKSGQIDCSPLGQPQPGRLAPEFIEKCVHVNTLIHFLAHERGLIPHRQYQSEAIESMLSSVQKNAHWHVRLLNANYADTITLADVTYLMSTVGAKPLLCRIKELVHFVYVRIVMVSSLGGTLILAWLLVRAVRRLNAERDKEFFALVGRVTALVEKQYEASLVQTDIKPYLVVAHVYDTLVEPSKRASKRKLWAKVVKFIDDHESRIHVETQFIDGEETLVWKWVVAKSQQHVAQQQIMNKGIGLANSTMIATSPQHQHQMEQQLHRLNSGEQPQLTQDCSSSSHNQLGSRDELKENQPSNGVGGMSTAAAVTGWQGDAFNRSEKLVHSPTPCLKIRNMFSLAELDSDPLCVGRIHNDILEKCCSSRNPHTNKLMLLNHSILHISCDKKSKEGCVYIKCSSNEGAGRAYQALNGTWYNGKLLTVKFLRSDRYLERFPDSVNFNKPLQMIQI